MEFFSGVKVAETWVWLLTSISCPGKVRCFFSYIAPNRILFLDMVYGPKEIVTHKEFEI